MRFRCLIAAVLIGFAGSATADERERLLRLTSEFVPPAPKSGHSYPECYCRDSSGGRVELGQTACLRIGSREVTARCEKASNLVIWRQQAEGCTPGV